MIRLKPRLIGDSAGGAGEQTLLAVAHEMALQTA